MEFIDLKRDQDVSSLGISEKNPGVLNVIGELPHGCQIAPRSLQSAQKLIAWLENWIERQES